MLGLSFAACANDSTDDLGVRAAGIELRQSSGHVSGNAWQCAGAPTELGDVCTPVHAGESTHQAAFASAGDDGVDVYLEQAPIEIDTSQPRVVLELHFTGGKVSGVDAYETTNGFRGVQERSAPTSGWIEVDTAGPDPGARQSGRFELKFDWGSVAGTFDTGS
jgi:hypothetical protein